MLITLGRIGPEYGINVGSTPLMLIKTESPRASVVFRKSFTRMEWDTVMNKQFNPQLIEDISAWLFWTQVKAEGIETVARNVLTTRGQSLLTEPGCNEIFSNYPLQGLSVTAFSALKDAVADYAYEHTANHTNLTGTIYLEDRITGRAPSANNLPTAHLNFPLDVTGDASTRYGKLCLRAPLPAVVFSDAPPPERIIRVDDTSALGFNMPLWLAADMATEIQQGVWVSGGIFYIPESPLLTAPRWSSVIPNAVCAWEGIILNTSEETLSLKFNWK